MRRAFWRFASSTSNEESSADSSVDVAPRHRTNCTRNVARRMHASKNPNEQTHLKQKDACASFQILSEGSWLYCPQEDHLKAHWQTDHVRRHKHSAKPCAAEEPLAKADVRRGRAEAIRKSCAVCASSLSSADLPRLLVERILENACGELCVLKSARVGRNRRKGGGGGRLSLSCL